MMQLHIVCCLRSGLPCELVHESRAFANIPEGGILMIAKRPTPFGDRDAAEKAIERTRVYTKEAEGLTYMSYAIYKLEAVLP